MTIRCFIVVIIIVLNAIKNERTREKQNMKRERSFHWSEIKYELLRFECFFFYMLNFCSCSFLSFRWNRLNISNTERVHI